MNNNLTAISPILDETIRSLPNQSDNSKLNRAAEKAGFVVLVQLLKILGTESL